MLWAVAGLIFLAAFYAAYSIAAYLDGRQRRSPLDERLEELHISRVRLQTEALLRNSSGAAAPEEGPEGEVPGSDSPLKVLVQVRRLLGRTEARLARRGLNKRIEHRLRQAGLRLRASEFLALRAVSAVLAGLLALFLTGQPVLLPVCAVLGYWLPQIHVERVVQKRLKKFGEQLPEALTVIANSLRSGYSFLQAVDVAAGELPDPIAAEFRQVVRETQVDIPLEDAMANLLGRVPSPELQLVVTAVLIQRQVGGNLANLLDQVSETLRQRIRFHGEVKALTAQGRMSGWVVSLLPVGLGLFMYMMNPEYIGLLFKDPVGQVMLGGAVLMELAGGLIIRRMVQIEM